MARLPTALLTWYGCCRKAAVPLVALGNSAYTSQA